jgi:DNA-binding NtrC family response regulator
VKGAFTGAAEARAGKFELAHGGTLFLDEVGELSGANQVRLLRVLEERAVERVGGTGPIDVDVRLVAATNRDLEAAVREGGFRGDLLFRLKVFTVAIPPLRRRPRDVRFLAERFVAQLAAARGKRLRGLDEAALARLQDHDWPGNVRELRNALEHAVVLERGEVLGAASLPPLGGATEGPTYAPGATYEASMARAEKAFLRDALLAHDGDTRRAAEALAMPLRTLQARLQRLGLKSRDFRGGEPA